MKAPSIRNRVPRSWLGKQAQDAPSPRASPRRGEAEATAPSATADGALDRLRTRLEEDGHLPPGAWERARRARHGANDRIDQVVVKLGLVSESRLADAMAEVAGLPRMTAADAMDDAAPLRDVSVAFLKANAIAPLRLDPDGRLIAAIADPFDGFAVDALSKALDAPIAPVLATRSDIDALIAARYERPRADTIAASVSKTDVERLRDLASEAPIIRLVNELVHAAARAGASDLHLEPSKAGVRTRLRVDGALREHRLLPNDDAQAIASRMKIMARLDIAERRLPQDGRCRIVVGGREIDLRVSTMPTLDGEALALRLLDTGDRPLELDALGLDDAALSPLLAMLDQPNGVILVTGPTGSGKTTTLYASLNAVAAPERKVLTVEDPVEYRMPGAIQVQVKPEIGLGFATALRAFLRHDPDIVMIGEIRDDATAEIAIQAALTGHLVLSTLHTNSAAAAIGRLLDMGVEDYLLASTLIGAIAQRLVRRLCPDCKAPSPTSDAGGLAKELEAVAGTPRPPLWRATGCPACGGTGFRGRRVILEAMPLDDALRDAIARRETAQAIERRAVDAGMRTLWRAGLALALAGETTVEEVARAARTA